MKKFAICMIGIAVAVLSVGSIASSASDKPVKSDLVATSGAVLNAGDEGMFLHKGKVDMKKEICLGETIPVYREEFIFQTTTRREVGKIKVLDYVGENRFKAQVVEGQVKNGDVARKDSATCLLPQPGMKSS